MSCPADNWTGFTDLAAAQGKGTDYRGHMRASPVNYDVQTQQRSKHKCGFPAPKTIKRASLISIPTNTWIKTSFIGIDKICYQ